MVRIILLLLCSLLPTFAADASTWRLQFYGQTPCASSSQGMQVFQVSASGLSTGNPRPDIFSDADYYQAIVQNGGQFGFIDNIGRTQFSLSGCGQDPINVTETATFGLRVNPGGAGIYYVQTNNHVPDFFCGNNSLNVTFNPQTLLIQGSSTDSTGMVKCAVAVAGPNVPLPDINATPPPPPSTPACPDQKPQCPLTLNVPARLKDAAEYRYYYSSDISAVGGQPPYTFTKSNSAPKGIDLDSGSGVLSGTPRGNYPDDYIYPGGTFTFLITVTDSVGNSASALTALDVNPPLSIYPSSRPILLPPATETATYYSSVHANGGGYYVSYTNRWTVTGLPAGITYSATGVDCIFGGRAKPGSQGTYPIVISVDDGFSRAATVNAIFTVVAARTRPVQLLTNALPQAMQGDTINVTLAATGGSGTYTWAKTSDLPPQLTLASSGVLSGAAAKGMDATYSFSVRVTDSDGKSATGTLTLQVLPPPGSPLHLNTTTTLPTGYAGHAFNATIQPLGGFPPYIVALDASSPALPQGLVLNSQGILTGTPQSSMSATLVFKVTDGKGQTSTTTLPLTISGDTPPSITSVSPESAPINGAAFWLTVKGNGFPPGATVLWNGQPLTTNGGANALVADVPASLLTVAGVAVITVSNDPNPPIGPFSYSILSNLPSQLTIPVAGSTISSTTVFQWLRSISAQYRLQVGDSGVGTNNLADQSLDSVMSNALVSGLPLDGRTIYVRLGSLLSDGWHYQDSTFKTAMAPSVSRATVSVTLNFTNSLLYPLNLTVNGTSIGSVAASSTAQQTVSITPPLMVSVDMVRPTLAGTPLGDPFSGSFSPITNPTQVVNYTITNQIGSQSYFVPILTNTGSQDRLMGINMLLTAQNLCHCIVPAGAKNVAAGYYKLYENSSIRLYLPGSNYTGPYIYFGSPDGTDTNSFVPSVESKTGALRVSFH